MLLGAGDHNHDVAPQPKAIHLHHVVDLVTDRSHGPQVPELIREMPEGASGHAELALGLFREQPPQEQL